MLWMETRRRELRFAILNIYPKLLGFKDIKITKSFEITPFASLLPWLTWLQIKPTPLILLWINPTPCTNPNDKTPLVSFY